MSSTAEFSIQYFPDPSQFGTVGLGSLYVGTVNGNPAATPADRIQVYIARQGLSDLPIDQPIDLSAGGVPVYNGSPVTLKVNQSYSMAVLDRLDAQVYYSPNNGGEIEEFEEIDGRLDALEANRQFTVPTYIDLLSMPSIGAGQIVTLQEHTSGYVGGGDFIAVSGSVANDGGTKINSATPGIYWKRMDVDNLTIEDFGAYTTLADNSAPIQKGLDYINSIGGGVLKIPTGVYNYSTSLNIYKNTTLTGLGKFSSKLMYSGTSHGIKSTWTINGSTAVRIRIENFWLSATPGINLGGGIVDVAGTFVDIYNMVITFFRRQIIFDQTEIATIDLCDLEGSTVTAIWLVNGDENTPGALGGFTNRIAITRCQFNNDGTGIAITDDGGYVHTMEDNNFNGFNTHIRVAGGTSIAIGKSELEAATGTNIIVSNFNSGGAGVGGTLGLHLYDNTVSSGANVCMEIVNCGSLVMDNNVLISSGTTAVLGIENVFSLYENGNTVLGGAAIFDDYATHHQSNTTSYALMRYERGSPAVTPPFNNAVDIMSIGGATNAAHQVWAGASGGTLAYAFSYAGNRSDGSISYDSTNRALFLSAAAINRWSIKSNGNIIPVLDNAYSIGEAANRATVVYATTGTINTSDARSKTEILPIDDAVLRAWGKVKFYQYKLVESVKEKGINNARIHFGSVVQQVIESFESEGLDPFAYGLICYDEWGALEERLNTETGEVMQEAREAGNRYGLRYDEALVLECAYLRSRLNG